ncbi:cutinase family protein, partial [Enterococcus faecium]
DIGANDMSQRIQYMAANCPDTRLVLGGYSLGAAVTAVVIAVPIAAFGFKNPLPDGVDRHIAAVALFGNGSQWVGPIANFTNPALRDRIVELCH